MSKRNKIEYTFDELRYLFENKYRNLTNMSKDLNINVNTLRSIFSRNKYDISVYSCRNGNIYNIYFIKDKEFYYYFLGFIAADGSRKNNRKNEITIEQGDKDMYILELFRDKICPNKRIAPTKSGYHYITFNNKIIGDICDKHNIVCNKTKDLSLATIPIKYIRHFIRGYFDGDGCCYVSSGDRIRCNVSILCTKSTAKLFMDIFIDNDINSKCYQIKHQNNGNFYRISIYSKESVFKIFDYFYKDSQYYLKRKYNKFIEFMASIGESR